MLKSSVINVKFLDYLLEKSFITISDLATKGYSTINDDKYKKILNELGINAYTDEPTQDVNEYYKKSAGKRTKRDTN